jgi:hypothetical protein
MYADRVVPIRDLAQVRADLGDIDSQIQRAITDQSEANRAKYPATSEKDAAVRAAQLGLVDQLTPRTP